MSLATGNPWKIGLFVMLGVVLATVALIAFGAARFGRDAVPVVSYFDESVQGLDLGSPVKFRGVTVGNVDAIRLAPDLRHVEVHMGLDRPAMMRLTRGGDESLDLETPEGMTRVSPDLRLRLVANGITGLKFIEMDLIETGSAPPEPLPFETPWNTLPTERSLLRDLEQGVTETIERMPLLMDEVTRLTRSLEKLLTDVDVAGVATELKALTLAVQAKVDSVDTVGLQAEARTTLEAVQSTLTRLEELLAAVDLPATAASVRTAAGSVTGVMRDAGDLSGPLLENLAALRAVLDEARDLLDLFERNPSALLTGRAIESN